VGTVRRRVKYCIRKPRCDISHSNSLRLNHGGVFVAMSSSAFDSEDLWRKSSSSIVTSVGNITIFL
jgi:hypothetical protein